MKLMIKTAAGLLAAMLFAGTVAAETIHPRHAYDDDWDDRVMRFTPEWHQDDAQL